MADVKRPAGEARSPAQIVPETKRPESTPATPESQPKTWADFESEDGLYWQLPAQPLDVRRKFIGHDKAVWTIAKAGRKVAFAKYSNLPRKWVDHR